jgi:hypothetical protein
MSEKRTRQKLDLPDTDVKELRQLSVSRTEPYDQVTTARILLAYHDGQMKRAIARNNGVTRPTVDRCIKKALCAGIRVAIRTCIVLGGLQRLLSMIKGGWSRWPAPNPQITDMRRRHGHAINSLHTSARMPRLWARQAQQSRQSHRSTHSQGT